MQRCCYSNTTSYAIMRTERVTVTERTTVTARVTVVRETVFDCFQRKGN